MARPKRMGAYNALDDLLPGPAWGAPDDEEPGWGAPGDQGPGWGVPGDQGPGWGVPGDERPGWDGPGDRGPGWDLSTAGMAGEPAPPARRPRLEPVPDPPGPARRRARDRRAGANALDELLPGPRGGAGVDELLPGPSAPAGRRLGVAPRPRSPGRHLGVWNPLDGPPPPPAPPVPAPPPVPAKVRVSFRLPADLVETARDAVAHLAGTADRTNLTALTERALRVELARLAITHNHGQPFTPRDS
jgi:hypothetical protein